MQVYLWGQNTQHQIRSNNKKRIKIPQKVSFPITISTVCFSKSLMMILSNHGNVYEYRSVNNIKRIDELSGIVKLKCGDSHYAAIDKNKQLYTWGVGNNGCLVKEFVQEQLKPVKIKNRFVSNVIDVFCGPSNTFVLNDSNELYGCGDNQNGQLGVGSNNFHEGLAKININGMITDIASDTTHTMFLTSQGQIYTSGWNRKGCLGLQSIGQKINIPIKIISKDKFVSISCGGYSIAINQKGSIFVWGYYGGNLISTPTVIDKISKKFIDVKSRNGNSYALSQDGELWVWGSNQYGELGVGDTEQRNKPFPVVLLEQIDIDRVFIGMNSAMCIGRERAILGNTFKRQCCDKRRNSDSVNRSFGMSGNFNFNSTGGRSSNSKSRNSNNKSRNKNRSKSKSRSRSRSISQSKSKQLRSRQTPQQPKIHLLQFIKSKELMKQTIKQQLKQHFRQNSLNPKLFNNRLISDKCPIKVIDEYCDRQSFIEGEFQGTYSSIPHYDSNVSKREQHNHRQYRLINKSHEVNSSTPPPHLNNNLRIEEILQENRQLKQIIQQKDNIIQDIVSKIQALEEAIDQRDSKDQLTLRQHIQKQVQRMENRYIGEISKLSRVIQTFALRYNTETTAYDTLVHKDVSGVKEMNKQNIIMNITSKCKGKHISTEQSIPNSNQLILSKNLTLNPDVLEYQREKQQSLKYSSSIERDRYELAEKVRELQSKIVVITESFECELQNSLRQLDMYKYKVKQLSRIVVEKNQIILSLQNEGVNEDENLFTLENITTSIRNTEGGRDGSERKQRSVVKLKENRNGQRENNHIGRVIQSIEKNKRKISLSADKLINILQST